MRYLLTIAVVALLCTLTQATQRNAKKKPPKGRPKGIDKGLSTLKKQQQAEKEAPPKKETPKKEAPKYESVKKEPPKSEAESDEEEASEENSASDKEAPPNKITAEIEEAPPKKVTPKVEAPPEEEAMSEKDLSVFQASLVTKNEAQQRKQIIGKSESQHRAEKELGKAKPTGIPVDFVTTKLTRPSELTSSTTATQAKGKSSITPEDAHDPLKEARSNTLLGSRFENKSMNREYSQSNGISSTASLLKGGNSGQQSQSKNVGEEHVMKKIAASAFPLNPHVYNQRHLVNYRAGIKMPKPDPSIDLSGFLKDLQRGMVPISNRNSYTSHTRPVSIPPAQERDQLKNRLNAKPIDYSPTIVHAVPSQLQIKAYFTRLHTLDTKAHRHAYLRIVTNNTGTEKFPVGSYFMAKTFKTRKRYEAQLRFAQQMLHPNIVMPVCTIDDNTIVTPYISGHQPLDAAFLLGACSKNARVTLPHVLSIAAQLIAIVMHVHSNQIVLRSIEPEDFVVDPHRSKIFLVDASASVPVTRYKSLAPTARTTNFAPEFTGQLEGLAGIGGDNIMLGQLLGRLFSAYYAGYYLRKYDGNVKDYVIRYALLWQMFKLSPASESIPTPPPAKITIVVEKEPHFPLVPRGLIYSLRPFFSARPEDRIFGTAKTADHLFTYGPLFWPHVYWDNLLSSQNEPVDVSSIWTSPAAPKPATTPSKVNTQAPSSDQSAQSRLAGASSTDQHPRSFSASTYMIGPEMLAGLTPSTDASRDKPISLTDCENTESCPTKPDPSSSTLSAHPFSSCDETIDCTPPILWDTHLQIGFTNERIQPENLYRKQYVGWMFTLMLPQIFDSCFKNSEECPASINMIQMPAIKRPAPFDHPHALPPDPEFLPISPNNRAAAITVLSSNLLFFPKKEFPTIHAIFIGNLNQKKPKNLTDTFAILEDYPYFKAVPGFREHSWLLQTVAIKFPLNKQQSSSSSSSQSSSSSSSPSSSSSSSQPSSSSSSQSSSSSTSQSSSSSTSQSSSSSSSQSSASALPKPKNNDKAYKEKTLSELVKMGSLFKQPLHGIPFVPGSPRFYAKPIERPLTVMEKRMGFESFEFLTKNSFAVLNYDQEILYNQERLRISSEYIAKWEEEESIRRTAEQEQKRIAEVLKAGEPKKSHSNEHAKGIPTFNFMAYLKNAQIPVMASSKSETTSKPPNDSEDIPKKDKSKDSQRNSTRDTSKSPPSPPKKGKSKDPQRSPKKGKSKGSQRSPKKDKSRNTSGSSTKGKSKDTSESSRDRVKDASKGREIPVATQCPKKEGLAFVRKDFEASFE